MSNFGSKYASEVPYLSALEWIASYVMIIVFLFRTKPEQCTKVESERRYILCKKKKDFLNQQMKFGSLYSHSKCKGINFDIVMDELFIAWVQI